MNCEFFQGILLLNMDYVQVLEGRLEPVEYIERTENYNEMKRIKK